MAGFLRKKAKQDPPSKELPPATSSSPASSLPPPLFARFATTAQNSHAAASPRIVSSPMALTGRKEPLKAGSGMASSSTLVAGGRDAELAVRRQAQEQFPAAQASMNGAYYSYSSAMPPSQAVPLRSVSVDKPLPSPIAAGFAPSPAVTRRATATRAQGPPPSASVPNYPLNNARSRASLDMRDREKKPLPHPGAVQASGYYWQEPTSPPPSPYKFTPKTPPKRNASASTPAATPQIGKMQPLLPVAYGQQGLSTPDAHAGYFAGQSTPPSIAQGPVLRQGFPPSDTANASGMRNGASNRMSVVGSPQTRPVQDLRGTPMSDRVLDLPPEFALFQVSCLAQAIVLVCVAISSIGATVEAIAVTEERG